MFIEIVRTGTMSTSISSLYVCSSHFPRVHLGENHANDFGMQWVQSPSKVTNERDATMYKILSYFFLLFLSLTMGF